MKLPCHYSCQETCLEIHCADLSCTATKRELLNVAIVKIFAYSTVYKRPEEALSYIQVYYIITYFVSLLSIFLQKASPHLCISLPHLLQPRILYINKYLALQMWFGLCWWSAPLPCYLLGGKKSPFVNFHYYKMTW